MAHVRNTGVYWDGGPIRLQESLLTQKITTNNSFVQEFTHDLRDRLEKAKAELDNTMSSIDLNQTNQLLQNDTFNEEVKDLDAIVQREIDAIDQNDYKAKLEEKIKLEYQAAQYIAEMKRQFKELTENYKELADKTEDRNKEMLVSIQQAQNEFTKEEDQFNIDQANRLRLTKMVTVNPPPKFDNFRNFGTPTGMLAFFNEDLEEYFDDMMISERKDKSRLIIKTFGGKSAEYKATAKRFFQQTAAIELIKNVNTSMRDIYKELVYYIFTIKPKGDIGCRKQGESLTNYLQRWFTSMDYCGKLQNTQGTTIIRKILDKPKLLKVSNAIVREIKKQFFVKYANEERISKEEILGFAQRLDMLYADETSIGMKIISTIGQPQSPHMTGTVIFDE